MPPVIRVFCRFSMRQAPCHFSSCLPTDTMAECPPILLLTLFNLQGSKSYKGLSVLNANHASYQLVTSSVKSGLVCFRWLTYIMDETKRKLFTHIFSTFFLESLKKLGFMRLAEENFFLKNYLTSHFSPKNCKITTKNSYF